MLALNQFHLGTLNDALPLSLVITEDRKRKFLVGGNQHEKHAICVAGLDVGLAFKLDATEESNWRGLIIDNVSIEVDERRIEDPDRPPHLSLVRTESKLFIVAQTGIPTSILIADGLISDRGTMRAAFSRWQITIGTGAENRVLVERKPPGVLFQH